MKYFRVPSRQGWGEERHDAFAASATDMGRRVVAKMPKTATSALGNSIMLSFLTLYFRLYYLLVVVHTHGLRISNESELGLYFYKNVLTKLCWVQINSFYIGLILMNASQLKN